MSSTEAWEVAIRDLRRIACEDRERILILTVRNMALEKEIERLRGIAAPTPAGDGSEF